jgi:hypothetical protein
MATYENGDPALRLRDEWLADASLLRDDGRIDGPAIRERVVDILVTEALVADKSDKDKNAITKSALTLKVVPVAALAAVAADTSPERLEADAFRETEKLVWDAVKDGPNDQAQKAIRVRVPGAILVKTRLSLSASSVPAAYVTTNESLIWLDYVRPRDDRFRRLADTFGEACAMIASAQPALAKRAESTVNSAAKTAGQHAKESFTLALGSANGAAADMTETAV